MALLDQNISSGVTRNKNHAHIVYNVHSSGICFSSFNVTQFFNSSHHCERICYRYVVTVQTHTCGVHKKYMVSSRLQLISKHYIAQYHQPWNQHTNRSSSQCRSRSFASSFPVHRRTVLAFTLVINKPSSSFLRSIANVLCGGSLIMQEIETDQHPVGLCACPLIQHRFV